VEDEMTASLFDDPANFQFTDFTAWAQAARDRDLELYGASNGSVAQDGPRGTCRGFWGYGTQRGWLAKQ
jgi:hypothetical protein